jgi:capsular exopolysaccharide synthesis family protein
MDLSNRVIQERVRVPLHQDLSAGNFAIDLRRLLRVLGDRRNIILGTMGVVAALVALVAFQLPPRYSATVQVLIDPRQTHMLDVQAIFAGGAPEASQVDSQVHVIKSEALLARLIDKQSLAQDAEFNTRLAGGNLFKRALRGLSFWMPGSTATDTAGNHGGDYLTQSDEAARLTSEIVENVGDHLRVRREETALVIDISFSSLSATKAMKLANALADLYVVDQLETKYDETRRATTWLQTRLRQLEQESTTAQQAVADFKREHDLVGSGLTGSLDTQQLTELQKRLIESRIAREQAESELQSMSEALLSEGNDYYRLAKTMNSPQLTALRQEEALRESKLATLGQTQLDKMPSMIAARREVQETRGAIAEEARRIKRELEAQVKRAQNAEDTISASLGQTQSKSSAQSGVEAQLRQLELEAQSKEEILKKVREQFTSITNQEQIQQSDARIISPAIVPRYPSFPDKKVIVAGGLGFGLLIGIFLALFVERLDHGVRGAAQLEEMTGLRNLAVIPGVGAPDDPLPHDFVLKKPLSAYSEAVRGINNALTLAAGKNPPGIVIVTSSLPGEGKSTLSLSLARLSARMGKRTLLLDCDLRRPTVAKLLPELKPEKTIVELLEAEAKLEEAIVIDPQSGLHIIMARDGGDRSPDLIASAAMSLLLRSVASLYDLVVIDSPPVLPVGDTLVLSRYSDSLVYVVRWDKTPRDAIANGLRLLSNAGARVTGTALSQVDFERYTKYSYGEVGSHYKRYQGYYAE